MDNWSSLCYQSSIIGEVMLLIKNAYIITMDNVIYDGGSILIEDSKIKAIGDVDFSSLPSDTEVYDAQNKIIIPGLVNTHVHLSQQLGRGLADDVNLLTWLRERIWPYESNLNYDSAYLSSVACCVELVRSGVTTFVEAGGQYVDAMVEAVSESGLKANLCKSVMDIGEGLPTSWDKTTEEELQTQVDLVEKYHNKNNINIWFGLRTVFNNSDRLIQETKKLADQYKTGVTMHVAEIAYENQFVHETRNSPSTVEHLYRLGVLDKNLLAVHTVWLNDREVDLFKLHDVKVSHNPAAAMKVCLGFAQIPEMLHKGIAVSIGTDGAPSNNRMDILRDMYLTAIIHKGRRLDPETIPAEEILKMATINGALGALREDEIGKLAVGKEADLVIINPNTIHSLPMYNPIANIVYSMSSENVESTMSGGKWLMKEKKILFVDEEQLLQDVIKESESIRKRVDVPIGMPIVKIK